MSFSLKRDESLRESGNRKAAKRAETVLKYTSFPGEANRSRARFESSQASVISHKNVHVSSRNLIASCRKRP